MKRPNASTIFWIATAGILLMLMSNLNRSGTSLPTIAYSQFLQDVKGGKVEEVNIQGEHLRIRMLDGSAVRTFNPNDPGLVGDLVDNGVVIRAQPPRQPSFLGQLLLSILPLALLIGVWVWFMRRTMRGMGGPGGITSFGQSRAKELSEGQVNVTLADVAGVEEAKEEVAELVEFLSNPAKFQRIGGMIPRGVLMVGPPGTGKTLLARAIAGEAGVPFFSISGSDFVEMFVGVGASRVRDLFKKAKEKAPCIIFVDEIDAVGRRRGAGLGGGHDEREQTLNQLLVEMDGFSGNEGVIIIAATNRPDVLDPALLRPGRFDRQVVVGLPDVLGREQILKVHMRKVVLSENVDARIIARGTPGFSGADLANLVNEAALLAARANESRVNMDLFEKAKDKIMMGAERRSMAMSAEDKRLTAYHEAGHAIVGRLVPEHDPVHKVTIIPRGRALGVTLFLPEQDRYSASKRRLESQISSLFGGRLAELLIFGADSVTTGAQNDIQRATAIAREMVTKWGLSDKLGPLSYEEEEGEVFLGRSIAQPKSMAPDTAEQIDAEVRAIIERNYERAKQLLVENMDKLHAMAEALIRFETISSDQIDAIMQGQPVPEAADDSDDNSTSQGPARPEKRPVSVPPRLSNQPVAEHFQMGDDG
ncbi:MAG: ATP-dependent zinc metalloprotease FtsH [Gammaproteobacteria bacterium]|nr:ATP-dependent zinc metalloprotease FtsH [Gammaproteobacteria bacterium]